MKLPLKRKVKAQSAMEYLMTYGWAILIISVVLAALWSIGVFSSPGGGGSAACVGTIGYLCGTPTLESNGLLLTTIGQTSSSGTLSVTGLGCSNSSMQPSTFYSASMTLPPSQATSASFDCPLPNSALGAAFTGTLWIQYNLGSVTGLVSRLGTVNTKVIMSGSTITLITGNYVPITLSNLQISATGSNFQQMITVSTSYTAYGELANMQNVEFTTGIGGTGTILQAWCESSCTSSSTSTWWVNLASDTMAAAPGPGNSITIYMDFMPSSVMSSSGPTGEAPQISGTYAQYDNGANIFIFYDNFATGETLSTYWKGWVNVLPGSTGNGVTLSTKGMTTIATYNPSSDIAEMYGYTSVGQGFTLGWSASTSDQKLLWGQSAVSGGTYTIGGTSSSVLTGTTAHIFSVWNYDSADGEGMIDYSNLITNTGSYESSTATGITMYTGGGGQNEFSQYVRVRLIPPSSVMSTVSFGTAV